MHKVCAEGVESKFDIKGVSSAPNQHIYQPVGKPDHSAPPKKPPRPGAPSHLGSLASLNSPVDSYNEGVKTLIHLWTVMLRSRAVISISKDLVVYEEA
uniref:Uncharacterized protein n=1 Tax=Sphaerodactylus townsendi TaxID=933632 RepID=A0ACB8FE43_9SAUR